MSIKRAYYYLFYKLYRFWNKTYHPFLSGNLRAELSIIALEIWLLLSIGIYYVVFTKTVAELTLFKPIVIIPFLFIIGINYYAFIHTDNWKEYCKEFDRLPKEIDRRWALLVWFIIIFIMVNLIFSFYLMSQIDWKQYR